LPSKQNLGISKDRYYLGIRIKSQLRDASYSFPCKQKEAAQKRRVAPDERSREMTEMAIRSRMAVLVVAALLAVAGALGTEAFLAADDAHAAPYNPYSPCVYQPAPWCK